MTLADQITGLCEEAITRHVFPGCVVGYIRNGRAELLTFGRVRYGEGPVVTEETMYDVASVTKSVVTASVALKLVETGQLSLDDAVVKLVPELENSYREEILLRHLLTYTLVFDIKNGLAQIAKTHPTRVFEELCAAPLAGRPGEIYHYTNAPAIILTALMERLTKKPLDALAQEYFFKPLAMKRSTLRPEQFARSRYAPTEIDWRGEVQGVVHDEAAWAMYMNGQLAGDAGLFTTGGDLLKFCQMLLNGGRNWATRVLKPETVAMMHTNQIAALGESTAMGWELNWQLTMGDEISHQAFGKTGFTGCSVIIDPIRKGAMIHLSNRLYPHRPTSRDEINQFRRNLADIIFSNQAAT